MIPLTVYIFAIMQLIAVSWIDITERKISNYWFLFNVGIYCLFLFLFPHWYNLSLETFFISLVILLSGFVLFKLNIMGAGDSKYLASFFLLIPFSLHEKIFSYCLYSIILAGSFVLFINALKNFDKIKESKRLWSFHPLKNILGVKMPFSPVILISWIWFGVDYWEDMV